MPAFAQYIGIDYGRRDADREPEGPARLSGLSIRFQPRPPFRVQFRPLLGKGICLSA